MEKAIKDLAEESPEARLLMTMPGLSYYSSLLILSEIGEIDRFPSAGQLCSYAGLVPSVYASGGVVWGQVLIFDIFPNLMSRFKT